MTDLVWKGPIVNTQSVVSDVDFTRFTRIQEDWRKDEKLVDKCGDNSGVSTTPDVSTQSSKGTWWLWNFYSWLRHLCWCWTAKIGETVHIIERTNHYGDLPFLKGLPWAGWRIISILLRTWKRHSCHKLEKIQGGLAHWCNYCLSASPVIIPPWHRVNGQWKWTTCQRIQILL